MMHFKDLFKLIALVAVIAFLTLACTSSEPKSDFELDVNDDEITVAVSEAVARGLMEDLIGADLECDGEVDGHLRALLEKLDRDGPRARASYRDGEDTVSGRRRGGRLDLEIRGDGPGKIEATMPWAVAECLLGQDTSIDETFTSSIKVKVSNADGRNFSFRLQ
jgi:hypothetical protein